ncbi:MAG: hypothetical protein ACRDRE_23265, partial [Pseudonocardiaceae bacterium]
TWRSMPMLFGMSSPAILVRFGMPFSSAQPRRWWHIMAHPEICSVISEKWHSVQPALLIPELPRHCWSVGRG